MRHQFREHAHVLPPDIRTIEDGQCFRQLQASVRTTELDSWGHPAAIYGHREPDDPAHSQVYATPATIRATLGEGEVFGLSHGPGGWEAIKFPRNDYAD
jgi:hypothetical protein